MCDMVAEEPITPHSKPVLVRAVAMTPVPLFNKQRSGCRPFCEVYVGDERVATTSQEYDRMRCAGFLRCSPPQVTEHSRTGDGRAGGEAAVPRGGTWAAPPRA